MSAMSWALYISNFILGKSFLYAATANYTPVKYPSFADSSKMYLISGMS